MIFCYSQHGPGLLPYLAATGRPCDRWFQHDPRARSLIDEGRRIRRSNRELPPRPARPCIGCRCRRWSTPCRTVTRCPVARIEPGDAHPAP